MSNVQAILVTMTTYGTWLRGDARGWVDDGIVFPPDPVREAADLARMKYPEYLFPADSWHEIGTMIGDSLTERTGVRICAMTVMKWHTHLVVSPPDGTVPALVKCAKDAVRWGLRAGRPIWGDGYDKRYCYDERSVLSRIAYVERHNTDAGRPAKPWSFIQPPW